MIPEIFNDQKKVTFYYVMPVGDQAADVMLKEVEKLCNKDGTVFSTSLENAIRNYLKANYDANSNPPFDRRIDVVALDIRRKLFKKNKDAENVFESTDKPTEYLIDLISLIGKDSSTISNIITSMPDPVFNVFSPILNISSLIGMRVSSYYIGDVWVDEDESGVIHFKDIKLECFDRVHQVDLTEI